MKKSCIFPLCLLVLGSSVYVGIRAESPPVSSGPAPSSATPVTDNQKLYGPPSSLVSPEQAQAVVDRFKAAYGRLGSPRLLIYVNRELVDTESGLKLTKRVEHTTAVSSEKKAEFQADPNAPKPAAPSATQVNVAVGGGDAGSTGATPGKGEGSAKSEQVEATNTYVATSATAPALADRQTVRDIERLFGRPLRTAGAKLADQKVAASMLPDKSFDHFSAGAAGDQGAKDREALGKVADVAIEILVSSRNIVIKGVSGDQVVPVPDIQATAIRLSDAQILGQASASDVLGRDQQAGRIAKNFGIRDITEATALALMDDMSGSAQ